MKLGPGRLDRSITIERATMTANSLNEQVATWSELTTVSASRRFVSDGEKIAAGQVTAFAMARFIVRHSDLIAGVSGKDRLIFDGRTWNIHGNKPLDAGGRDRFREITAVCEADA